jgi:hypothetical protein
MFYAFEYKDAFADPQANYRIFAAILHVPVLSIPDL